jgi:hypothetical protein
MTIDVSLRTFIARILNELYINQGRSVKCNYFDKKYKFPLINQSADLSLQGSHEGLYGE